MKRTLNGMNAYSKMLSTAQPEKTETYTPISHASVINRVRSEITNAGFIITGEDYRCSNDGQVALGTLRMNYKSDPDIEKNVVRLHWKNVKQFLNLTKTPKEHLFDYIQTQTGKKMNWFSD